MTEADKMMHPQHFGTDPSLPSQTSGSRLIRKSVFESWIAFGRNFGVGGGLRFLSALVIVVIIN